jgi:uncharacterized protein YjbI with pentapeptide repeats
MKFSPDRLRRVLAVLDEKDRTFRNLVRVAQLRPDRDLVGADLRRVEFGGEDFSGFDFAGTDLRGANLAGARGLRAEMFVGVRFDESTCWPDGLREAVRGFDVEAAARACILAGQAPPASWRPFIRMLDLSASFDEQNEYRKWQKNRKAGGVPPPELAAAAFHRLDLLAGLANLHSLDLTNTQVSDVAPLARLANLHSLYLRNTQVSDVAPLASLANLQRLDLGGTQVSDVAPLARLDNLRKLDLRYTQVRDVSALAGLTGAEILWEKPKPKRKRKAAAGPAGKTRSDPAAPSSSVPASTPGMTKGSARPRPPGLPGQARQ